MAHRVISSTPGSSKSGSGCLGAFMISSIVIVLIAILFFMGYSAYNGMVSREEGVNAQWAQVENVYQRRADLITNLVNVVKGYAAHEKETLTAVIEARSKATSVNIDPSNLDEAAINNFQQVQDGLSSALSRLMVVVERYPDLKANSNFMALQTQLEDTENQIAVERASFNETARTYNVYIRKFPKNIFASMFGFKQRAYFQAQAGADTAPVVQF